MNVRQQMESAIAEQKKRRKEQKKFIANNFEEMGRVAAGLEVVNEWLISLRVDGSSSLDISVSGDHNVFKGLWAALRKLGYDTTQKPKEEKISGYTGWWYNPDTNLPLYINFSSTKCKMVKIGTKTVEQPVYELVCE